jgi:hydrogenase maturation protein HypF
LLKRYVDNPDRDRQRLSMSISGETTTTVREGDARASSRVSEPQTLTLPVAARRVLLAVGARQQNTFALGAGARAILGRHIGELDEREAPRPEVLVHDLHPEYASTAYAKARAAMERLEAIAVQHHHAHIASCMADNGLARPVIGVAFDGAGHGTDGRVWGGEFLVATLGGFRRVAHLRYVPMPGGELALREPWRMALSHLLAAKQDLASIERAIPDVRNLARAMEHGIDAPLTSSMGRLFDAVAALVGLRTHVTFEGQAAMMLEALASGASRSGEYPITWHRGHRDAPFEIDPRALIAAVAEDRHRGTAAATIARRFHCTLAAMIAEVCQDVRATIGIDDVALSGGVFMNTLLLADARDQLERSGFTVHCHRRVPPNDGGIALGQLAIAAHLDQQREEDHVLD